MTIDTKPSAADDIDPQDVLENAIGDIQSIAAILARIGQQQGHDSEQFLGDRLDDAARKAYDAFRRIYKLDDYRVEKSAPHRLHQPGIALVIPSGAIREIFQQFDLGNNAVDRLRHQVDDVVIERVELLPIVGGVGDGGCAPKHLARANKCRQIVRIKAGLRNLLADAGAAVASAPAELRGRAE